MTTDDPQRGLQSGLAEFPGAPSGGEVATVDVRDAANRLRRIETITELSVSQLPMEELLDELLRRLRTLFEVDTAAVLLVQSSGELVPIAARGLEEEVGHGVRIPFGQGFAGRIAAGAEPIILTEVNSSSVVNRVLVDKNVKSLLGVPLFDGADVIGVLHIGALAERSFDDDDIEVLRLAADRAAAAVTSRRADLDRASAATLQQSLAPRQLPSLPGYTFAARYVPGSQYGVSGDWYDVFTLPGGEVGIAIGDVMGHGLGAATLMGRIKSALRAHALEHDDPAVAVRHLDHTLQHFEPGQICTLVYAVLAPGTGAIRFSSAGHLPLVLASPSSPARLIGQKVGLPLGVDLGVARTTNLLTLERGGLLGLFTDGLIDQRTIDLDVGLATAAEVLDDVAHASEHNAETACTALFARTVGENEVKDDVTILAVGR